MGTFGHFRLRDVAGILLCVVNVVLANYTYDALGRRITFNDPVAGVTTRYYYDGSTVIEERNGACPGPNCDNRVRYHVNGNQFIDEHVATFTVATGQFTYYLSNANYSIAGTGNADGSVIERLNYSATGDFVTGPPPPPGYYHDADDDLDIDLRDFASFRNCFDPTPPVAPACAAVHDFDTADASDGVMDLDDYAQLNQCSNGPFITSDQACGIPMRAGALPPSGTFGMHGRAFDVLSDASVSQDFRARTYLPQLGRWLQRDRLGFADGPSLYESFRGNTTRFVDPQGEQIQEIINLFLTGRFLCNEEIELALLRGDVTLGQTRSKLLGDVGNALTALVDVDALLLVPQGFEQGFRGPAIEATTGRFEAFIFSQVEAGASLEEASSNVQLVALFGGDITGVTALGESVFGVELATNEALSGSARVLRGVQGGSQIVLVVATPPAVRQARARTLAARAAVAETISAARSSIAVAPSEGIPLRVLNAEFTPSPHVARAALQQVTTQVSAGLASDLSQARLVLSEAELRAARLRPDVARLSFGKTVERLVRARITNLAGSSEWLETFELSVNPSLRVQIDAVTEIADSKVAWRFTSIDAQTGNPPEDPLAGLLPPNVNPPEGEGSVVFAIMPKPNLPTGTVIRNRATITFDTNAPIETGEWINTIDNSKPESRVEAFGAVDTFPHRSALVGGR